MKSELIWVRALVYFGCIFTLGFLLGVCRVVWLVPRVGDRAAELIEMPIMLAGIVVCARWLVARFPAPRRGDHLRSGLLALAVMLAFEFSVVSFLRGISLSDYLATRDVVSGSVYAVALILFAVMPWAMARASLPDKQPAVVVAAEDSGVGTRDAPRGRGEG